MAKISRQQARETLFGLLFETEFKNDENPTEIFNLSCANREIPTDAYIKNTFFGIVSKSEFIDAVISKYSKGWRADRLSKVSRTILRIAIYEIFFIDDIHPNISISQAVELSLKYGEDRAKQFVNGVLSGLFKDIEKLGIEEIISKTTSYIQELQNSAQENIDDGDTEASESNE